MNIEFKGLEEFIAVVDKSAGAKFRADLRKAMNNSAIQWQTEAKQRIPVETGVTRNTILKQVVEKQGEIEARVGSNQEHAPFIEFGTRYIADGRVLALGTDPEITDQQAIHTWPAKEENAVSATSSAPVTSGRAQEQMPWLRPSFMAIRSKVIERLRSVLNFKR